MGRTRGCGELATDDRGYTIQRDGHSHFTEGFIPATSTRVEQVLDTCLLCHRSQQGRQFAEHTARPAAAAVRDHASYAMNPVLLASLPHHPEGDSPWTYGCTGRFGDLSWITGMARRSGGTASDGRLFSGFRGGELPTITYRCAWIKAREACRLP